MNYCHACQDLPCRNNFSILVHSTPSMAINDIYCWIFRVCIILCAYDLCFWLHFIGNFNPLFFKSIKIAILPNSRSILLSLLAIHTFLSKLLNCMKHQVAICFHPKLYSSHNFGIFIHCTSNFVSCSSLSSATRSK